MPWAFNSDTKLPELLFAADLRIELVVVDDVVAVFAARDAPSAAAKHNNG